MTLLGLPLMECFSAFLGGLAWSAFQGLVLTPARERRRLRIEVESVARAVVAEHAAQCPARGFVGAEVQP